MRNIVRKLYHQICNYTCACARLFMYCQSFRCVTRAHTGVRMCVRDNVCLCVIYTALQRAEIESMTLLLMILSCSRNFIKLDILCYISNFIVYSQQSEMILIFYVSREKKVY